MWKFAAVGKKAAIVAGTAAIGAYGAYQWKLTSQQLSGGGPLDAERLDQIFAQIDTDGSGSIDVGELQAALTKVGKDTTAIGVLLRTADKNHDGKLTKEEFRAAMLGGKA